MALTRGKRKLGERHGLIVVLKGKTDPDRIIRKINRKLKRRKKQEASTYEPFNLLSTEVLQHILSFVDTGQYVFLASINQDFHSALKCMSDNDFKTKPSSYINSWKLTRRVLKVPANSPDYMKPKFEDIMNYAIIHDSLYVFQNLLRKRKWVSPGLDWRLVHALKAIRSNAVNILKWIIKEQHWDYNLHKDEILAISIFCNLEMITYLHEHLRIDFNLESLLKMVLHSSRMPSIRYVLGLQSSMTALNCCQILHCAIFKQQHNVAKMLCEELYDPENDPDMSLYGVQVCCGALRGIDLVKCVINSELHSK